MNEGAPVPIEEKLTKDEFDHQWDKEKDERHLDNLSHFTGFFHGTFFLDGTHPMKPQKKIVFNAKAG